MIDKGSWWRRVAGMAVGEWHQADENICIVLKNRWAKIQVLEDVSDNLRILTTYEPVNAI